MLVVVCIAPGNPECEERATLEWLLELPLLSVLCTQWCALFKSQALVLINAPTGEHCSERARDDGG
jgi:hypothetical protein